MSSRKINTFLKILVLVAICLLIAFLIVWPLWKFATAASKVYTWVILGIILALIIFSIFVRIKKHAKK